jgi:hypothetical protein
MLGDAGTGRQCRQVRGERRARNFRAPPPDRRCELSWKTRTPTFWRLALATCCGRWPGDIPGIEHPAGTSGLVVACCPSERCGPRCCRRLARVHAATRPSPPDDRGRGRQRATDLRRGQTKLHAHFIPGGASQVHNRHLRSWNGSLSSAPCGARYQRRGCRCSAASRRSNGRAGGAHRDT